MGFVVWLLVGGMVRKVRGRELGELIVEVGVVCMAQGEFNRVGVVGVVVDQDLGRFLCRIGLECDMVMMRWV